MAESRANLFGHPLHPVLIVFPASLFPVMLFLDVLYAWFGTTGLWTAVFWLAVAGVVTAAAAAVPGFVDYLGIPSGSSARTTANWHMGIGLATVLAYGVAAWVRFPPGSGADLFALAVGIDVVGVLLVSVQGYLGGSLVYQHHLGVRLSEEGGEPTPFTSTDTRPRAPSRARQRGAERP